MKLSVLDRIMLLNVLPKEGSFANLKILRIAREIYLLTKKKMVFLNLSKMEKGLSGMTQ